MDRQEIGFEGREDSGVTANYETPYSLSGVLTAAVGTESKGFLGFFTLVFLRLRSGSNNVIYRRNVPLRLHGLASVMFTEANSPIESSWSDSTWMCLKFSEVPE